MMVLRLVSSIAAASLLLVASGCGRSGHQSFADLVPCYGTVTFDGEPLDHGTISFAPMDVNVGQPASGIIKDGRFTMATTVSASGVVMGKYHVIVESLEPSELEPGRIAPAAAPTSLIPLKYSRIATSGLEVEVTEAMSPLEFDLDPE